MLAEGRRRPDQGIGPLNFQFRREPRALQHAQFSPVRRGQVVLRGEMLSQRRQERVPPLTVRWFSAPDKLLRMDGRGSRCWLVAGGQALADLESIRATIPGPWIRVQWPSEESR